MSWQDWVFFLGNIVFALALLPAVLTNHKPPLSTCFLTAAWLWAYCGTFFTLGLPLSAYGSALTAFTWSLLALQKAIEYFSRMEANVVDNS